VLSFELKRKKVSSGDAESAEGKRRGISNIQQGIPKVQVEEENRSQRLGPH
jgi:hypothetical protein